MEENTEKTREELEEKLEEEIEQEKLVNIHKDPFIKGLKGRLPGRIVETFTDEQLISLKVALGARQWGSHPIDVRQTLGFWKWRFYFVLIAGKENRTPSRQQRKMALLIEALAATVVLAVVILIGMLMLYVLKSAFGINLFGGYSLGIWDWITG